MGKQGLAKNYILQFTYQFLTLVIPLFIYPYLTRTLGVTALGTYSYSNSIAYYFLLFAMLGIARHGQRIISTNSNDEIKLRKSFWSLMFVHFVSSIVAIIAYLLFVKFFIAEGTLIFYLQTFYVVSALFDITWFFYGLENVQSVVIKNTVIRVIECAMIFIFVHSVDDLWKYTLISTLGLLIGQVVLLPQAIKIAKPIKFTMADIKEHIKPLLVLFVSVVASSLYTVFDKTLLGILTSKDNVAFYEYSSKIVSIPKAFIMVIGTVMYARACKMINEKNIEGQKRYMHLSFLVTSIIGFGTIFGLLAIAKPLAIYYYGESFAACGGIIMAMSPLALIVGLGDILRTQYLIPSKKDSMLVVSICLSAVVNLVLSTILIPELGVYGVVIGTISAEIAGLIFQLVLCKEIVRVNDIILTALPFGIIGAIMFLVLKAVQNIIDMNIKNLVLLIFIGMFVFGILTIMYIWLFERPLFNMVIERFKSAFKHKKH